MGFWAWFWIWVGLVLGSLIFYAVIGKSLFDRGMDVFHQIERIAKPAQALIAALDSKTPFEAKESDLLTPVGDLEAERQVLLKRKTRKLSARQRSLRSALKNIDVNESRFTND
jgi:hypothetical protein